MFESFIIKINFYVVIIRVFYAGMNGGRINVAKFTAYVVIRSLYTLYASIPSTPILSLAFVLWVQEAATFRTI